MRWWSQRALVCWSLCVMGCAAPQEQVVLVEPLGGAGGSVTVEQGTQSRTLTAPLASVEVRATGLDTRQRSAADVQIQFGATLQAIPASAPAAARAYVIGFASGAADLPQDAEPTLTAILADVATHGVGEVAIIGHTDTVGSRAANERLAQARAVTVRDALLARGLYARRLHVDGHGERALLVPTADHVAEPRNRRVEIRVQ